MQRGGDMSEVPNGTSLDDAAKQMKVSRSALQRARHVREHGTESLGKAVEEDVIPVSTAAEIADLPEAVPK